MTNRRFTSDSSQKIETYFSHDYLHFGNVVHSIEASDREVEAIWALLELGQASSILEIGCGYGRITNRLAKKGAQVTGLDASPTLLKEAEARAAELHVGVEYVLGDMRSLPWENRFDAALLWYTTFGYFDDVDNERVLHQAASALRKGGRLLIDQHNRFAMIRDRARTCDVLQCGDDLRIDILDYDALTDRRNVERVIVRNGNVRRTRISIRHYGFSEYVRMLRSAGFETVDAYGQEGTQFTSYGPRLVIVAHK
ncbi:class I SAM-dependent methyltransferase [Mesorhizobium sp. M0306]|uniref:class I SAM-dependent methyltransferase n=1 Tax=Mesorhizobium sp. M0306 TaxID=2956932 RepID=UPI003339FDD7